MKIISAIPLKKGIFKGNLTYFASLDIPLGNIISIPARNKKILGLVVFSEELREMKSKVKKMDFNLKKVIEDKGPSVFRKEFLEAVLETEKYFAQNKSNSIASLIPNIFVEKYDEISKIPVQSEFAPEEKNQNNNQNLRAEKLLFQSPLEDRISIYKTLIRESFARGKSVFIVLPTESGIEIFADNLSKGIEQFTFSMHSKVSAKKILVNYKKIMGSAHPVLIVGTPPFLSIPKKDIGTIILEQESFNAYRMIGRPYLDLRIFAEILASKIGAKFILADNLLRFETLERKEIDHLNALYPLSFRIDFPGTIEVLGKESNKEKREFKVLQDKSLEEIKSVLQNKKNVFIFSLRKGLATITLCRDCGNNINCDKCGSTLVLYTSKDGKKKMFVCNKCSHQKDASIVCPACGSWNLIPLGIGTDMVSEYVKKVFPKIKIFKLDKESAKNKSGATKIIEEFENENGAILIGTEMALFYLKNKIPLSLVASFDSLWSIPNFRMGEKILKILLTIMRKTENKFIIQTKNNKDGAILAVQKENLLSFVREELEDRKILGYPPFERFIKITHYGEKKDIQKAKEILKETFKEYNPQIFSGFIQKKKGFYVTNALIKIKPVKWTLPAISIGGSIDEILLEKLLSLPPAFQVSVDPEDLL